MASLEQHCADCKAELGEEFRDVHVWLDQFYDPAKCSYMHRAFRHHDKGVSEAFKIWGEKGAKAVEIHIKRDFPTLNRIPTQNDWTNANEILLPHCDFMQERYFQSV